MPSIFNPSDNAALIARIESLQSTSTAQWGKMNVAQMLAHCQRPILVAFGELKLKRTLIGYLFGPIAKKKILNPEQGFGKNSPTDAHFIVQDQRDLDVEKAALLPLVRRFAELGPTVLSTETHPFFGKMTVEEWDALIWGHLNHHLLQFGA